MRSTRRILKRLVLALAILGVLFAMAAAATVFFGLRWIDSQAHRVPDGPRQSVRIAIPKGTSVEGIADLLHEKGLLRDRRVFVIYVWRHELSRRLQAGDYQLHTQLSVAELAEALQSGYFERRVMFPEGTTIAQMARRLAEAQLIGDAGDFTRLKADSQLIQLAQAADAPSLEGFLFPDTYSFEPGIAPRQIAERMIRSFNRHAADALSSPTLALDQPLSRLELVTLASMIEREARSIEEMPLMASVYYNRLKRDMRMECDATVHYALDDWSRALTYKDLEIDSPYNTYRHKGLPPGPICNPSKEALRAAAHPARSRYLFYVYRGDGTHEYTETYEAHQAAIAKYLRN